MKPCRWLEGRQHVLCAMATNGGEGSGQFRHQLGIAKDWQCLRPMRHSVSQRATPAGDRTLRRLWTYRYGLPIKNRYSPTRTPSTPSTQHMYTANIASVLLCSTLVQYLLDRHR